MINITKTPQKETGPFSQVHLFNVNAYQQYLWRYICTRFVEPKMLLSASLKIQVHPKRFSTACACQLFSAETLTQL
jgi:hypothetical protein